MITLALETPAHAWHANQGRDMLTGAHNALTGTRNSLTGAFNMLTGAGQRIKLVRPQK